MKSKKRGFVLTLDVVFAVAVISTALASSYLMLAAPSTNAQLIKTSQDLSASLEYNSSLESLLFMSQPDGEQAIGGFLNLLPANMGGRMTFTVYRYSGGFSIYKTMSAERSARTAESAVSRRLVISSLDDLYGIAELEVWYE
ncbi:MAG: hypothetical protein V1911_01200 [Candidatus Micrarchaeota archaeon]